MGSKIQSLSSSGSVDAGSWTHKICCAGVGIAVWSRLDMSSMDRMYIIDRTWTKSHSHEW